MGSSAFVNIWRLISFGAGRAINFAFDADELVSVFATMPSGIILNL